MIAHARGVAIGMLAAILLAPAAAGAYTFHPSDVAVSPDGHDVYATGELTVTFSRDPQTGRLTQTGDLAPGGALSAISPGGRYLFVARTDRFSTADSLDVLSRDPASGVLTLEWRIAEGHYGTISKPAGLAVSPDGHQLYVSQAGPNALVVYDIDTHTGKPQLAQTFARDDFKPFGDVVAAPDGRDVYVSDTQYGDSLRGFRRDPDTGLLTAGATYPKPGGNTEGLGPRLAMSPDGTRLYGGTSDYDIFERNPATGALTFLSRSDLASGADFTGEEWLLGASPDGNSVFSSSGGADWHHVVLHQAQVTAGGVGPERTYVEAQSFRGLVLPRRMRWSPDGRYAYLAAQTSVPGYDSGSRPGITVLAWDADSRTLTKREFDSPTLSNPPAAGPPTVTIDAGALYTNDPNVTISFTPPTGAASFRIAGDSGGLDDGPARRVDPDGVYTWRLDTTGAAPRDVRHVYLRVWTMWGDQPIDLSDDIVLDQSAPTIIAARVDRGKLTVRAKDNRSGVRRMQVTRDRSKPGKRHRFAERTSVPSGSGKVYVRVFDGAHNRSLWRAAKN